MKLHIAPVYFNIKTIKINVNKIQKRIAVVYYLGKLGQKLAIFFNCILKKTEATKKQLRRSKSKKVKKANLLC